MTKKFHQRICRIGRGRAARLLQRTDGSISVETVLVLPLVIWALTAAFTFTDVFRHQTSLQKSVHTAADIVSRASGNALTPDYLDGVFGFMERMTDTDQALRVRMSLIGWDDVRDEFRVVWSHGSPAVPVALDDVVLNAAYRDAIPAISPGETLLMVEGALSYEPPFRMNMLPQTLSEVALVRPRFAPGIAYLDPTAPPPPEAWCAYVVDACGM